jgi:hypothetical protein
MRVTDTHLIDLGSFSHGLLTLPTLLSKSVLNRHLIVNEL